MTHKLHARYHIDLKVLIVTTKYLDNSIQLRLMVAENISSSFRGQSAREVIQYLPMRNPIDLWSIHRKYQEA